MSACVPSAPRYILCVDATAPRTWTYTQTHTHTNKSTAWHEHDAIERQLRLSSPKRCLATGTNRNIKRAHGVVVSHPLRMRKALGSIPSGSICQDLILLPCVFAYTRGLCHNTEHQRQTLKGANVFLEKTDLTLVVVLTPRRAEHTKQEFAEPYPFTQATAVPATNFVRHMIQNRIHAPLQQSLVAWFEWCSWLLAVWADSYMPACKKIFTTSVRASAAGPYVDVAFDGGLPSSYMLRPEWPRQRDRVAKVMD